MAKAKKSKKAPRFDENGHWVEERNRIKGAIRRTFRLFPQHKASMDAARVELSPALKKDGTPGKKPRVRYRCAVCGDLFSQKDVNVDHIETVVPLWKTEREMTYDEIVRGICCGLGNLQVLCSTPMIRNGGKKSCHAKKTDEEKYIRSKLVGKMPSKGLLDKLKLEHKKELEEKEAKKNGRRKKNTKRKSNP